VTYLISRATFRCVTLPFAAVSAALGVSFHSVHGAEPLAGVRHVTFAQCVSGAPSGSAPVGYGFICTA